MSEITELDLMAFVDGELDASRRDEVARAVRTTPALQERARVYAQTKTIDVFDRPLQEAVPPDMERLVRDWGKVVPLGLVPKPVPPAPGQSGKRVWSGGQMWTSGQPLGQALGRALAAVALIAAGAAGGWLGATLEPDRVAGPQSVALLGDEGLMAGGELQRVLESEAGRPEASAAHGPSRIVVRQTFRSKGAEFCRSFEIGHGEAGSTVGVACRSGEMVWRVDVQARQFKRTSATPASAGPIKDYIVRMIDGEWLSAADEAAAIRSGWPATAR